MLHLYSESAYSKESLKELGQRLLFSLTDVFARRKLLGNFMNKPCKGLCVVDANAGNYPAEVKGYNHMVVEMTDFRCSDSYYRALRKEIQASEKGVRVIGIITGGQRSEFDKLEDGDIRDYINLFVVKPHDDLNLRTFLAEYPEYKDKSTISDFSHFVVNKSVWDEAMLLWLKKELESNEAA